MAGLVWPNGTLNEPTCTDVFGPRTWSGPGVRAFHTGDDAIGFSELRAIGAGTVVESGWSDWAGWQVLLYLGEIDGTRTWVRYCHLAHQSSLRRGDAVTAGAVIGVMGMTGVATGVHLHWEIYRGSVDRGNGRNATDVGSTVDPRAFVRARLTPGGQEEDEEMPDSMYAVVDGVQSWCWINWATGKVFACHTQAEANWVAGYMGPTKKDFSKDPDKGTGRYKNLLAMLGILAPKVEIIGGALSEGDLKRLRDQIDAGVAGALSGLTLKATV